jgi:hypothetical protein
MTVQKGCVRFSAHGRSFRAMVDHRELLKSHCTSVINPGRRAWRRLWGRSRLFAARSSCPDPYSSPSRVRHIRGQLDGGTSNRP